MKDIINSQGGETHMLCAYCNTPRSGKMRLELDVCTDYCETCGPDPTNIKIEIHCDKCKKLLYSKEGNERSF